MVATRVDRLGRSALQVMQLGKELREKNVHLVVLDLGVDTRTIGGELILNVMAAFADWERKNNKEKQRRGIELARKKGKHLGRRGEYGARF
ncbi:recombinase family protein [Virgibacillus kekensis]|uniref:Recombinase family protein n=1 Tax=Virgibacillus kekensis TaxID=202261 RepID=A0ABV9DPA3_9BACI